MLIGLTGRIAIERDGRGAPRPSPTSATCSVFLTLSRPSRWPGT